LEAIIRDLQAQLGRNAGNSSLPPSANPPAAPKPVVKEPTGRNPGGQPGHTPCVRVRLAADRVQQVIDHIPTACRRCQHPLPAEPGPADPPPTWHQVAELPPIAAVITEHRGHTRTCPHCGARTHRPVPADIRRRVAGPRLTAAISYLSGDRHDSKRGVEQVVETLFGVPVALGTVAAAEQEMSAALVAAHAEAAAAARAAPVKNVDETGWKRAGRLCWLWTAVTETATCFRVHARRGFDGLRALLGDDPTGVVVSDRWSAYSRIPLRRRQVCWAHLRRDFQAMIDRADRRSRSAMNCCAWPRTCSCVGTASVTGRWPGRRCEPASANCGPRSGRCWSAARCAAAPRPKWSARTCWRWSRRCGRSRGSMGSSRPTTRPSGRCGRRCCGGRGRSAVTARPGAGSWSGC